MLKCYRTLDKIGPSRNWTVNVHQLAQPLSERLRRDHARHTVTPTALYASRPLAACRGFGSPDAYYADVYVASPDVTGRAESLQRRKEDKPLDLQRCESGHFYDPAKHSSCPHCGVPGLDLPTMPRRPGGGDYQLGDEERTRPKDGWAGAESDPVTQPLMVDKLGIDPVVGWLVCVEGPDRGRDYRIRSENNTIGRSDKMYVCISGDVSIARERHAVISYEPQKNAFYLVPGDARGLVYVNGDVVLTPVALKAHDQIELGKTKLRFTPFCGEAFQWKNHDQETTESSKQRSVF